MCVCVLERERNLEGDQLIQNYAQEAGPVTEFSVIYVCSFFPTILESELTFVGSKTTLKKKEKNRYYRGYL